MSNFQYITNTYRSNCLIEAIKAKISGGFRVAIFFCKPRFHHGKFQMCHFMWSDGNYDYDFSDMEEDELPWYKCLLFRGRIRQFPYGFAARYSKYRNEKRKQHDT